MLFLGCCAVGGKLVEVRTVVVSACKGGVMSVSTRSNFQGRFNSFAWLICLTSLATQGTEFYACYTKEL
jgi:hypothetical protein